MPERKYTAGNEYRYGFNGQEKSTELNDALTTAQFWEYDSRLGRRWNIDPDPDVNISPYNCFKNSPIWITDPNGDSTPVRNQNNVATQSGALAGVLSGINPEGRSPGASVAATTLSASSPSSIKPASPVSQAKLFMNQFGSPADRLMASLIPDTKGGDIFLGALTGSAQAVVDGAKGVKNAVRHPVNTVTGILQAQSVEGQINMDLTLANKYVESVVNNGESYTNSNFIGYGVSSIALSYVPLDIFGYSGAATNMGAEISTASKGTANGSYHSVAFETELPSNLYKNGYYQHFKQSNTALNNAMASDPAFANAMSELGIEIPRTPAGGIKGQSPAGWSWHHEQAVGIMQLVPKIQHTPGSIYWNTLHPGGFGGMAVWGH
ncbi:MAG: HNH endonuclease [Ferruginibacter sp.]